MENVLTGTPLLQRTACPSSSPSSSSLIGYGQAGRLWTDATHTLSSAHAHAWLINSHCSMRQGHAAGRLKHNTTELTPLLGHHTDTVNALLHCPHPPSASPLLPLTPPPFLVCLFICHAAKVVRAYIRAAKPSAVCILSTFSLSMCCLASQPSLSTPDRLHFISFINFDWNNTWRNC